ncbi:uncharacterized protein LOC110383384 [Helicoverpa armigera]|uniref:uncharacterized protein LOC110383384 n=1 Tax=Helicoverpa armigera TaxID=29058 RepID=UPI003083C6A3
MISVTRIVFIASALTLALAQGDADQCTTADFGEKADDEMPFDTVELTANVPDWSIAITAPCTDIAGVHATICDNDVKAVAHFVDANTLLIHRPGNLQGVGKVDGIVYCRNR